MAKGLTELKRLQQEAAERQASMERPNVNWFKWPAGTNRATFRFLQELDENSPNYSPERGVAEVHMEHEGPKFLDRPYLKRACCTADDADGLGACYACERNQEDYKNWPRARANVYINALVDFGDGKPEVRLISRPLNNSFITDLIQESEDEGSITDANYRVIRTGEKTTTKWSLKRLVKEEPMDDSGVKELNDIERGALRHIPYDRQEKWYTDGMSAPAADDKDDKEEDLATREPDW